MAFEAQLRDNKRDLAAADLTLTEEDTKQLDEVSALPLEYPGWVARFEAPSRVQPLILVESTGKHAAQPGRSFSRSSCAVSRFERIARFSQRGCQELISE